MSLSANRTRLIGVLALIAGLLAMVTEAEATTKVVGLRRLTEAQYRNTIADIFGPDIDVSGRFEPIVRPSHQLIAAGAGSAALSPAGLEQFDAMARGIAAQVFDEKHRRTFMNCTPKDEHKADDGCARQVLTRLGRYVLRHPLTAQESASYVRMARGSATQSRSFSMGLQLALAAMLVSPDFLYVTESVELDPAQPGTFRLDNYSRASRLSFLLWNTTPDDALLAAAARHELTDPAKLESVARRMVASSRIEAGVRAFFADMLKFEKFDDLAKDSLVYPRFNPAVANALPEQMLRMVVDDVVTRGEDYRTVFTTRRTFMTRALGPLYDVPVRAEDGWEPYEFHADDDRAGLAGTAGFLALYSHSGRSSPTLRGRAIRELLLCQPVPNPPGNVNFKAVQDISNPAMPTARDRLKAHATEAVCAACHKMTDPIGLMLEQFDGIGAFRSRENGAAIDVSGTLAGDALVGGRGLGEGLARDPSSTQCVAQRALEYALGHPLAGQAKVAAALHENFASGGYHVPDLFLKVATLPAAYTWAPDGDTP